ncbi:Tim10/DDP family zinc finger-domain-containing protein [Naematelia encephala]|uniref:Mitochondrial import inner membrane translocase subunit TIM9 n=1 Tax=Naematelia encephala TaxID=71784 RepID=A0A1Y2B8L9_9TREE|nr:Tim10/DDP family zinc finger-domain-containing protein [Naematelia encephala]
MDFSQLNGPEQAQMTAVIEKKQMQDFMKLYTGLVERCFNACAQDFTSKALTTNETTCVQNCVDKFLKHSERVGARFGEYNAVCLMYYIPSPYPTFIFLETILGAVIKITLKLMIPCRTDTLRHLSRDLELKLSFPWDNPAGKILWLLNILPIPIISAAKTVIYDLLAGQTRSIGPPHWSQL